jgi:hypothetical protein
MPELSHPVRIQIMLIIKPHGSFAWHAQCFTKLSHYVVHSLLFLGQV